MMQIGSTIQSHKSLFFQTRRSSANCNRSPLNPTTRSSYRQTIRASATASNELTLKTISNLDKLLQKTIPSNSPDSVVTKGESGKGSPEIKGKGLLEGLNLARLWPEMKAAEEMSPRQLNHLKRLLSKSRIEYSPRNSLAHRWREYHGSNDWYGMLDPLDENLRREMVRYGEFIQAAYHCFHSDPATSSNEAPAYRHVALPDRSYKVTKSLYATSSVGLPKWVDDVAPDLGWMTQRTSCVGYVAVCDDQKEISRMGRRDIVIALRGTATCLEWAENMKNLLVQVPGENDPNNGQSKVECGFLSLHKTVGAHVPSLSESVVTEIQRLMKMYKGETLSITVTGHSLGAALALLVADDLSTCTPNMPPVAVFSFGGPRVGNRGFVNRLNAKNVKVLRIVNSQDVITRVPGMFVSEDLDKKLRDSCHAGVLSMLDDNMPWAYAHAGTELKVDTKNSPFLKSNADVACCHDLEAYLHLVDGFLDSKCPFRSNTKRSLLKLLHEQNANVKKLYTNKANGLRLNLESEMQMPYNVLPSPSS